MARLNLEANADWYDVVLDTAKVRGMTMAEYVRRAVSQQLERDGVKTKAVPVAPMGRPRCVQKPAKRKTTR